MVNPVELKKRIEEIKEILGMEQDKIPVGIIPNEYCIKEPFCNYKAVYQKDNNAIFIHPQAFENNTMQEMTAFMAHELYHAYQNKTQPSLFDTQINQSYNDVGLEYIKQPLEMQAYAFQVAMLMLYYEVYVQFELEGVDQDTLKQINDLAEEYYEKYKDKFIDVVAEKNLINGKFRGKK